MKNFFASVIFAVTSFIAYCQPAVTLEQYAAGFQNGISDIARAGDGRLYVAEQLGYIKIIQANGAVITQPFLDIHTKVTPNVIDSAGEQGLLGIAFSPNYATDGYFYINYTNKTGAGNTVIARYHATPGGNTADANSEQILLNIHQPYRNHNGGSLQFGNDGYLYCALGDGGAGGDPGNRAQNPDSLLGKILRIDVSGGGAYSIPPDNPFVNNPNVRPEIWALGLRNPWRISFDRQTQDLWIADVGEETAEEINIQPASSSGGENYGWRCYEGLLPYNITGCQAANTYVTPVHMYGHTNNGPCSITGGYVYRGTAQPALQGYYLFADFCSQTIYSLATGGTYTAAAAGFFSGKRFSTFGEDDNGELFVADRAGGVVYRLAASPLSVSVTEGISKPRIYPSPNTGNFTMEFNLLHDESLQLEICDEAGRILTQHAIAGTAGSNTRNMDIGNMAPGLYFIKISGDGHKGYARFAISR